MHTDTLLERMAAIAGEEHVCPAGDDDAVDGMRAELVARPANAEQIAALATTAAQAGLTVSPRGGGTKLAWGNPPSSAGLILDMRRMHQVVEHAWGDMTATVQAGCTIAQFQTTLAEHGQRLAVDALWPQQATVGGVLATNDGGPLRVRFGGLRDQILGMTVVLADGTVARTGGKVVKNVAGYDMQKLMTGALGTLGVIAEATFRLYPLASSTRDCSFRYASAAEAGRTILAILDSPLAPSAVQLVAGSGRAPRVDVRFEGLRAALDDQDRQVRVMAGAEAVEAPDCWDAREALWPAAPGSLIARYSVLPADIAWFCDAVARVAQPLRLEWRSVTHALGVGWLRLDGANDEVLLAALALLRAEIEAQRGALSVLSCPVAVKQRIDVWGSAGSALSLMRRVKQRFDPANVFNPGRFVGRI